MPDKTSPNAQPADALVLRAKTDREAFGELYDCHHGEIYNYCVRRLANRTNAEDVCADVFLTIAKKMPRFPGATDDDFKRWAYRIATHDVNAQLRRSGRRASLLADAVHSGRISASDEARVELPVLDERASEIRQALSNLAVREQTLIELRYFDGLTHDDIASIVGARPGAVRTAITRAVKKLRERMRAER